MFSHTFYLLDNRQTAKPRRKRKSAVGNNANLPSTKDSSTNDCATPTKKRSPANNPYSQPPAQGVNNMPGVRIIII